MVCSFYRKAFHKQRDLIMQIGEVISSLRRDHIPPRPDLAEEQR